VPRNLYKEDLIIEDGSLRATWLTDKLSRRCISLQITFKEIEEAISKQIITPEQGESLWKLWNAGKENKSSFQMAHLAYYVGALIVISAMGWFMNNAWDVFGGMGMFSIAVLYAFCFVIAGRRLWERKGLQVAGGLMIVMAVCMAPLAIYGIEKALGWWPQSYPGHYQDGYHWVRGGWIWIELGTIASACLALRFFKFPFLTAPLFFSLYVLSIDVTPLIFGSGNNWTDMRWTSLFFGLAMMIIAFFTDYYCSKNNYEEDYAFWGYLFGTIVFWMGLTLLDSNHEWSKMLYCLINIALLIWGVLVQRKIFLVCGAIGISSYIGHLAYRVFNHSILFPFVLSFAGIAIIYLGILYNRNQLKIEQFIRDKVPEGVRKFLPK
jgi:hypothetical protein